METLRLPHKVLDYCCPINGFEDQYEWKTGVRLPGFFVMDLSCIGFTYLKIPFAPAPRMVGWGFGMGKPQHEFLAGLVGYRWTCKEGQPFDEAWQAVKASVEQGTPVILGLLDMYYLPCYPKFYHRVHIPQHFELLVGYDEARQVALMHDNGLPGIQELPLEDLRKAWNVNNPGQGIPNTYYILEFGSQIASLETIVRQGLKKRAALVLQPENPLTGIRGMRAAAEEIGQWARELSPAQWQESLRFLATFTCSAVPNLPQRLLPFPLGYSDPHQAIRDRFSADLANFARQYGEAQWAEAAQLLSSSGELIGTLTDAAVDALQGNQAAFEAAPSLMSRIADLEEQAFRLLL